MRSIIALLLIGGLAMGPAQAQNYVLQESTVSSGGATASTGSGSLTLTSSVGQVAAGRQQGNTVVLYSGYPSPVLQVAELSITDVQAEQEQPLSGDDPSSEVVTFLVDVRNRSTPVDNVMLHFRPGDTSDFEEEEMVDPDEDGRFSATVPVSERGLAYYVVAENVDGVRARDPVQGVRSLEVRVGGEGLVNNDPQPSGSSRSAYRLVSLPINADDKNAALVLEDDLGEYDRSAWRFFEGATSASDDPRELSTGNPIHMEPGRAFWLIVRDEADPIDTGTGTVLPIDDAFEIELSEGWNYVANPFNIELPVANLQRASGEPVELYRYEGDWSAVTDDGAMLSPFAGFALESSSDDQLYVDPSPNGEAPSSVQAKAVSAETKTPFSWSVRIAGRSGDLRDDHNMAAVAPDATAARDSMDWPEPPLPGSGLSVAFVRPEWGGPHTRYLIDVRDEPVQGATWPFEVETAQRAPVTLTFDGLAQVPEAFEVWLLDAYSKVSQNLRETPRYTIEDPLAGEARSFQLVVGERSYVEQALQEADALPVSYELADIYPNPTRGASTIRYGVPKRQDVTITIYNVLGQKVATLMQDRSMDAGFHTVHWEGETGTGAPVASGVYFVRMRAGDFTASKKIVRVN